MAREKLEEYYQNNKFHLLDLTLVDSISNILTGGSFDDATFDVFAITPLLGFNSIDLPDITINTEEITPGNSPYNVTFAESAETGSMTLSRGVSIGEIEFYSWIHKAALSYGTFRRNLLLVQFHTYPGGKERNIIDYLWHIGRALASLEAGGAAETGFSLAERAVAEGVPTRSRIWRLHKCLPTSYTPAQGLDADDGDITIAELELDVEYFEEMSLGVPPLIDEAVDRL